MADYCESHLIREEAQKRRLCGFVWRGVVNRMIRGCISFFPNLICFSAAFHCILASPNWPLQHIGLSGILFSEQFFDVGLKQFFDVGLKQTMRLVYAYLCSEAPEVLEY